MALLEQRRHLEEALGKQRDHQQHRQGVENGEAEQAEQIAGDRVIKQRGGEVGVGQRVPEIAARVSDKIKDCVGIGHQIHIRSKKDEEKHNLYDVPPLHPPHNQTEKEGDQQAERQRNQRPEQHADQQGEQAGNRKAGHNEIGDIGGHEQHGQKNQLVNIQSRQLGQQQRQMRDRHGQQCVQIARGEQQRARIADSGNQR